jgi:hypothetical protein
MLKPLAWGNSLVENSENKAGAVWPPSMDMVPKYKRNLIKWLADCPGQAKEQPIPVGQE